MWSIEKKSFPGNASTFERFNEVSVYEGGGRIWRVLATVYEAETEGSEGKVLNIKAKAMTVKKVFDKNEPTDHQDIKQQMESLATIMKSTTVGNVKIKEGEGVSSPKKKEVFWNSPKKKFQGSPQKGKGISKPGQRPIKCYRCDGWGHRWKECPTPENLNWRQLVGAVVSSNPEGTGLIPMPNLGHKKWFQKH